MRLFKQNIFMGIYAGVVALVALIAFLAYVIVQVVNYQRAQNYREDMADGVAFVMSEVLNKQPTLTSQQDWLNDVSQVLELPINLVPRDQINLTRTEQMRFDDRRAIVRFDEDNSVADIYGQVESIPTAYLHIRVNKVTEAQIKVIPILILEDLIYYSGNEQQRLKQLQTHFPYRLALRDLSSLQLDHDQMSRLKLDKSQTILIYQDSTSASGTTLTTISAYTSQSNQVLVLGPIQMFNWLPFELFAGVTAFSLLMLSLGTYILLRPLELKIGKVKQALNQVRRGEMDTRVAVEGKDEIALLGNSFNNMIEHIQRLISAQQELTRAVSHELRTPLARIRFGMEMLTDTDDYDSRVQQMEAIDTDIQALDTLIDETLEYAKLEQGIPDLQFNDVVLADLLTQVATEASKAKHGKQIQVELPPNHVIVSAERRYLHRVVQNFVGNAIRHSEHTIKVSGGICGGLAFICVEDDGAGIADKDREKVFEAFARLDDSRTRSSGGYGLGLSIVRRIAFWFEGKAEVDQSPTLGGARFQMSWPVKRDHEPMQTTDPSVE